MKRIFSFICVLCCFSVLSVAQEQAQRPDIKVKFLDSYEAALQEAASTNKPIFFDCYANWAVPCHGMDAAVFSNEEFAQWLQANFVCLRLEMTDPANQYLVAQYNVRFYAHYLILDPKGNLIHRIVGGSKLPEFKEQVARGLDEERSLTGMGKRYEAGERSTAFLRDYLDALSHSNEGERQAEVLKLYVGQVDTLELLRKGNWDIFTQVVDNINTGYYKFLLQHYDEAVSENGKETVNQWISVLLIRAMYPYLFNTEGYESLDMAEIKRQMDTYLEESDAAYAYYEATKARGEGRIEDFIALLRKDGQRLQPEILRLADVNLVPLIKDQPELKPLIESYLQERMAQIQQPPVLQSYRSALFQIENDGKGIQFEEGSFADALAKAKAEGRMVFMDCYTQWCGPCKLLAQRVFPIKEVGDFFNEHFVNIQVDMEKGEGIELAKRFNVTAYPTLLIIDSEGNLRHRTTGAPRSPRDFVEAMSRSLDDETAYTPVKAKYDAGDRSPRVVTEYLQNMLATGELNEAAMRSQAKAYFDTLSDTQRLTRDMIYFFKSFAQTPDDEAALFFLHNWKFYYEVGEDLDPNDYLIRLYFPYLRDCLPNVNLQDANLSRYLTAIEEAGMLKTDHTLGYTARIVEAMAAGKWKTVEKIYTKEVAKMAYKKGQLNLDLLWERLWPIAPDKMKAAIRTYLTEEQKNTQEGYIDNYDRLLESLK